MPYPPGDPSRIPQVERYVDRGGNVERWDKSAPEGKYQGLPSKDDSQGQGRSIFLITDSNPTIVMIT